MTNKDDILHSWHDKTAHMEFTYQMCRRQKASLHQSHTDTVEQREGMTERYRNMDLMQGIRSCDSGSKVM